MERRMKSGRLHGFYIVNQQPVCTRGRGSNIPKFCVNTLWALPQLIHFNSIDLRLGKGAAKVQGVVTGAGPGSMPQGGGWHVEAGSGRSEGYLLH